MSERLKVYLETTFVSWLVARPATLQASASIQAYTRQWWEEQASGCDLFVSTVVAREAMRGDAEQASKRMEILKRCNWLDGDNDQVKDLAARLVRVHAVPESEAADALHIATSAVNGMDILLTWNCKHMANLATLPKTAGEIARAGYECPKILTPRDILEGGAV